MMPGQPPMRPLSGGPPPAGGQNAPNQQLMAVLMPRLRALDPQKRQTLMGLDPAEVAVIAELLPEIASIITSAHRGAQRPGAQQPGAPTHGAAAETEMAGMEAEAGEEEEEEQEEAPPPPPGATPLRPSGPIRRSSSRLADV